MGGRLAGRRDYAREPPESLQKPKHHSAGWRSSLCASACTGSNIPPNTIITASADYLYVQFESLKNGFVDDVEFAVNANGNKVQVR